ncbi:hypothetical protein FB45DRAFT_1092962 [Roridomyces roridus]|uniref:Uncharacterized protein n=1 Tax=Roridomyces roridus TaxID=1738132 RepID=A0AAD7BHK6_9AGAR|nr:hypothetical protein FB45DRAFT_1092962 [Roridomyces roridus]
MGALDSLFQDQRINHVVRTTISGAYVRCIAACAQQADLAGLYEDLQARLSALLASWTIYWGDRFRSGAYVVKALDLYEELLPKFAPQVREAHQTFDMSFKPASARQICASPQAHKPGPETHKVPRSTPIELHIFISFDPESDCPTFNHFRDFNPCFDLASLCDKLPSPTRSQDLCQKTDAWTRLAVLAKERAKFADSFDFDSILNLKACDNTLRPTFVSTVRKIGSEDRVQTLFGMRGGRVPFITPRQRAFARAILHRDYTNLKLKIFVQAVTCMRASRDPHAGYFVVFDYSQGGGPDIGVYSLAEPSALLDRLAGAGIQWDLTIARAARSEGRMTIHVVRAREGKFLRHWVLPLRSDSEVIHEGLVKIACAGDGKNQAQDVKELVARSNSEVVEFH